MKNKLRWLEAPRIGRRAQISTCGRYAIWVQGKLLNGEVEWAAARVQEEYPVPPWLTSTAYGAREAKQICEEDLAKAGGDP